jgi:hypothetical protein
MSSMTAGFLQSSQTFWSKPLPQYQSQYTTHATRRDGNTANTCFTGGLPTPPGTGRNMNGMSVGSTLPSLPHNLSYPIRHPPPHQDSYSNPPSYPQHDPQQQSTSNGHTTSHERTNVIASHLQIPESINKSKGSLAEFATEVRLHLCVQLDADSYRSLLCSGSKLPRPWNTLKTFPKTQMWIGVSMPMQHPQCRSENG